MGWADWSGRIKKIKNWEWAGVAIATPCFEQVRPCWSHNRILLQV